MRLLVLLFVLASCTESEPPENPVLEPAETARCGAAARLVRDVCTRTSGTDECVDVDDVCVDLCDGATSCQAVDPELRVLNPWRVGASAFCVVCLD